MIEPQTRQYEKDVALLASLHVGVAVVVRGHCS